MDDNELTLVYPRFEIIPSRGILPDVKLPRNFLDRIPKFYAQRGKEEVEEFAKNLEAMLKQEGHEHIRIMLNWDGKKGLTYISTSSSSGYDLNCNGGFQPSFQEHNLGGIAGFAAGFVAMKYVSELFKSI